MHIPTIPPPQPPRPSTAVGRIGAILRPAAEAALDSRARPGPEVVFSASGWLGAIACSVGARPICE